MPKSSNSPKHARGGRHKATKNSSHHSSLPTEFTDVLTPLYLNSTARAAEFQKSAASLAAEHTSEWIGACKEATSHFSTTPVGLFFDMAAEAVQMSVETQKGAVDLVLGQTEAIAQIAKDRAEAYSKVIESATGVFQATMLRSVEAQKKVLESATEQNKATFAATRRHVGDGPASVLVDSFKRGAETVARTQKSILDATAQPFVVAKG